MMIRLLIADADPDELRKGLPAGARIIDEEVLDDS